MLLPVLLSLLTVADGGVASTLTDQARFIAGLEVTPESPLAALEADKGWQKHSIALDAGWQKLETNRLSKMSQWAAEEVVPNINPALPLVYLFGGPDAISVDVIYGDAPIYVLAGLEKPGSMPQLENLSTAEIDRGLDTMRQALRTTIDQSFFITSQVSGDLKRSKLQGVLPILVLMLARHGDEVLDATPVYLDPAGVPTVGEAPKNGVLGIRVHFKRGGTGAPRTLYYFSGDVANAAMPARPGLLPFLKSLGPFNSFLKAASFILHDRHFSMARDALLTGAQSILQDDSGLAFKALAVPPRWQLTFFGEYTPQTGSFSDHYQYDLKAAWDAAPKRPLPFRTGYKHQFGSTLILAVKKEPADAGTSE